MYLSSSICKLYIFSAVNKFWSRRLHWESRRQLTFRAPKAQTSWGGLGACSPRKFWNLDAWKCYFQRFPDSIWALRTIKTILTIFYVYYNYSFPQNLYHWLLERSKMINLQMLIQKNTFNVISSCCPFKKTCSAMSASVFFGTDAILAHAKAWDLVLWKCPRRSTTLRSASTFYTSTERLTRLKLKCAFT